MPWGHMATAQYERSGTSASTHPDPDPDPELRIKSPNSVPNPSVSDHRMQYLKSDVELGVRSIPVPYLFHTRSRPNKVFSTYSPCIIVGTSKCQSSFHTLRIKYAIQTLRIRQHRNVHSGHVVLISSHMFTDVCSSCLHAPTLGPEGYECCLLCPKGLRPHQHVLAGSVCYDLYYLNPHYLTLYPRGSMYPIIGYLGFVNSNHSIGFG